MVLEGEERLLLVDTCGDAAGVAVSVGSRVVAMAELSPGKASAEIVGAVRRLLAEVSWTLPQLTAVGVVSGPGSFTGMRTGLAAAKGLCEAAGLRLAAVSRLEVLADAFGLQAGFSVLDAGRGDLYMRQLRHGAKPKEFLCVAAEVDALFGGQASATIAAGDARSAERLKPYGAVLRPLTVEDTLPAILRAARLGGEDAALVEANYVRLEQDIYPRKPAV